MQRTRGMFGLDCLLGRRAESSGGFGFSRFLGEGAGMGNILYLGPGSELANPRLTGDRLEGDWKRPGAAISWGQDMSRQERRKGLYWRLHSMTCLCLSLSLYIYIYTSSHKGVLNGG